MKEQNFKIHELIVLVDDVKELQIMIEHAGRIVARVGLALPSAPVASFRQLYTDPTHRRKGFGSTLVKLCMAKARAYGHEGINCSLAKANLPTFQQFYKPLGFIIAAVYVDDGDAVLYCPVTAQDVLGPWPTVTAWPTPKPGPVVSIRAEGNETVHVEKFRHPDPDWNTLAPPSVPPFDADGPCQPCPRCRGVGGTIVDTCHVCHGTGWDIPEGWERDPKRGGLKRKLPGILEVPPRHPAYPKPVEIIHALLEYVEAYAIDPNAGTPAPVAAANAYLTAWAMDRGEPVPLPPIIPHEAETAPLTIPAELHGRNPLVYDIKVCHLPYQGGPYVTGYIESSNAPGGKIHVWLMDDGKWTTVEGNPACRLAIGAWEPPAQARPAPQHPEDPTA